MWLQCCLRYLCRKVSDSCPVSKYLYKHLSYDDDDHDDDHDDDGDDDDVDDDDDDKDDDDDDDDTMLLPILCLQTYLHLCFINTNVAKVA